MPTFVDLARAFEIVGTSFQSQVAQDAFRVAAYQVGQGNELEPSDKHRLNRILKAQGEQVIDNTDVALLQINYVLQTTGYQDDLGEAEYRRLADSAISNRARNIAGAFGNNAKEALMTFFWGQDAAVKPDFRTMGGRVPGPSFDQLQAAHRESQRKLSTKIALRIREELTRLTNTPDTEQMEINYRLLALMYEWYRSQHPQPESLPSFADYLKLPHKDSMMTDQDAHWGQSLQLLLLQGLKAEQIKEADSTVKSMKRYRRIKQNSSGEVDLENFLEAHRDLNFASSGSREATAEIDPSEYVRVGGVWPADRARAAADESSPIEAARDSRGAEEREVRRQGDVSDPSRTVTKPRPPSHR